MRFITKMVMTEIILVSCVSRKRTHPAPAQHIYTSDWFRKAAGYARSRGAWHILSAHHGVLDPLDVVAPYDAMLTAMPVSERRSWADRVAASLLHRYPSPVRFVVLAGRRYREHLIPRLRHAGHECVVPMRGLGIGQQKRWLLDHTERW